jgi:hypothetical protein
MNSVTLRNINGVEQKNFILDDDILNGSVWSLKQRIDPCHSFTLVHNGHVLCDSKNVKDYSFKNSSFLHMVYSIHGGGNDGGSIPTRGEMVKIKKSTKRNDKSAKRRSRWETCALSKQPLVQPIVADELGNIFNKEVIIKGLIEKNLPQKFNHIRSLKDVHHVNFTFNTTICDTNKPVQNGAVPDEEESPFRCPITSQPANGQASFSLLITCGHVISEKGLQQIDSLHPTCFICQNFFTKLDVLPLNPEEETLEKLRIRMSEQRALQQKEKKEICQSKLKRKLSSNDSNHSSKRPNQGSVRNTLAVQAALEKVNSNHDAKKRMSEAYKSIFSTPTSTTSSPAFFTGTSRGVIK